VPGWAHRLHTSTAEGPSPSPATISSRPISIEYVAGLFDGEGDCRVQSYRATKNGFKYLRVVARISNTHRGCLDDVRSFLGFGTVVRNNAKLKWKKDGTPQKVCFKYVVANKNGLEFLKAMRPWLRVKAETVDRILAGRVSGRLDD